AVPPRLRIVARRRAPVGEDLPHAHARLVEDYDHVACLDHLARRALSVRLQDAHRQTHGLGVVLAVLRAALLEQRGTLGVERRTALDVLRDVEENRERRTLGECHLPSRGTDVEYR